MSILNECIFTVVPIRLFTPNMHSFPRIQARAARYFIRVRLGVLFFSHSVGRFLFKSSKRYCRSFLVPTFTPMDICLYVKTLCFGGEKGVEKGGGGPVCDAHCFCFYLFYYILI